MTVQFNIQNNCREVLDFSREVIPLTNSVSGLEIRNGYIGVSIDI